MSILLFLVACSKEPAPTPAPASSTAGSAVAPAQPAAPAAGPDGPSDITVPALAAISTTAGDIAEGEKVFGARGCGGCHQFGAKLVGPDLVGVTTRRTVTWVQKMVSEPEQMTKKDPVAKDLFKTAMVQMPKQGVTEAEMPLLLAFIKSKGG